MNRNKGKKILSFALALTLVLGCFTVTNVNYVTAATETGTNSTAELETTTKKTTTKNDMSKLGLKKWSNKKKYSFTNNLGNNVTQSLKYSITNFKKTKSSKKGYNKITFTFIVTSNDPIKDKSQLHKYVNSRVRPFYYYAIIDSKTGKCLETANNKHNVTVKNSGFKHINYPTKYDDDGCSSCFYKSFSTKVTITYPKTYKDLGIVIGTYNYNVADGQLLDDNFWNGSTSFRKTKAYKKFKKYIRYKKIG